MRLQVVHANAAFSERVHYSSILSFPHIAQHAEQAVQRCAIAAPRQQRGRVECDGAAMANRRSLGHPPRSNQRQIRASIGIDEPTKGLHHDQPRSHSHHRPRRSCCHCSVGATARRSALWRCVNVPARTSAQAALQLPQRYACPPALLPLPWLQLHSSHLVCPHPCFFNELKLCLHPRSSMRPLLLRNPQG